MNNKRIYFYKLLFISLFFASGKNFIKAQQSSCLQLSESKFRWMVNNQMDSLNTILHENINYTHSNGWIQNKKEVIDDFQTEKLKLTNVLVKEAKETIIDNVSIISGKGIFVGKINEAEFNLDLTYTEVYIKQNGKWYLLSRHACKQH